MRHGAASLFRVHRIQPALYRMLKAHYDSTPQMGTNVAKSRISREGAPLITFSLATKRSYQASKSTTAIRSSVPARIMAASASVIRPRQLDTVSRTQANFHAPERFWSEFGQQAFCYQLGLSQT